MPGHTTRAPHSLLDGKWSTHYKQHMQLQTFVLLLPSQYMLHVPSRFCPNQISLQSAFKWHTSQICSLSTVLSKLLICSLHQKFCRHHCAWTVVGSFLLSLVNFTPEVQRNHGPPSLIIIYDLLGTQPVISHQHWTLHWAAFVHSPIVKEHLLKRGVLSVWSLISKTLSTLC